jgi:hypothetical protein
MFPRSIGELVPDYTASHARRPLTIVTALRTTNSIQSNYENIILAITFIVDGRLGFRVSKTIF